MDNSSILCAGVTDLCADVVNSTAVFSLNILGVLFNTFNLLTLRQMNKSKRNANFWILVNIGICDIGSCLAFSLAINCKLNRQVVTLSVAGAQAFQLAITIFSLVSFVARNFVLAIGSYERYISICHPYQVNTNKIVTNMRLCLGIVWIISFILLTISIITDYAEFCFSELGAILNENNKQTKIAFGGSVTAAFITSVICLSKVWKELKRMQSRSTVPAQDDLIVKRTAQYIIIVTITIYLSYFITIIAVVCNGVDNLQDYLKKLLKWIAYYFMTFNVIFTVMLYICMMPGYFVDVKNMLKLRKATVSPN